MELIGERQSLSLSLSDYITRVVIARKPCGGYSLRLHEGERLKRLKLSFNFVRNLSLFFLFFLDMRMVVKLPSRFLNIVSFISFFSFLFLESRFELMSRIREDRVFKGIKVEEPPVRFRWSVSRFPLAYYRRHTFPAAFYLNGDKIGARDRYAKRGARFRQRVSRVAFKHLILLKKKSFSSKK